MLAAFAKAWAAAPAAMGDAGAYSKPVFVMKDGDGIPNDLDSRKPWARANVRHVGNRARSISQRRSENTGFLEIQVFYPGKLTNAGDKVERLGAFIQEALLTHRGSVNLFDVNLESRPESSGFRSVAVNASFKYHVYTRES